MKPPRLNPFRSVALVAAITITACASAYAATATKAGTGTDLTQAASWSGGSGPGFPTSADVATWTGTSLGAGLTAGSAANWGSISITSALTDIDITGAGTITTGNIGLAGTRTLSIANNIALSGASIYTIADVNGTAAADATLSGGISGSFGIQKTGAGTLTLTGSNSYSGGMNLNAGTLLIGSNSALGTGAFNVGANNTIGSADGNARIIGNANTFNSINTTFGQTSGGTGDLTFTGTVDIATAAKSWTVNNTTTFSGIISGTTGTAFTKLGSGTLVLTGANTFVKTVSVSAGTLSFNSIKNVSGGASALGAPTSAALGTIAVGATTVGGTLRYTGTGDTTDRVINLAGTTGGATLDQSGTGILNFTSALGATGGGSKTLTLTGSTAGTGVIGGVIKDNSGTFKTSLTKSGTGTWTLSATNTYTGATNVTNGTLVVNGNISTSTLTTVSSGAIIGGSGTIGALTVDTGGNVNPGNSPGTLNTGNFSLAGALNAEINGLTAGTLYDRVNVTGTVNLTGSSLNMLVGFNPSDVNGDLFFLIANDGVDAVTSTFTGFAEGFEFIEDGQNWKITYLANLEGTPSFTGGNDVALMAIPEPASALLGGLGLLVLLRRRRA